MEQAMEKCVEYLGKEENVEKLESSLLAPVIRHISARFAWLVRSFQAIAALVIIQTALVAWLLWRSLTRS